MTDNDFLETERSFHDDYANRLDWDAPVGTSLSYELNYRDRAEEKTRALLGNIQEKRVLDIGSGHGNCALLLAKMGANVTSIDLSPKLVAGCKWRAACNDISADFRAMNACNLEFPDEIFDIVIAVRTVHHLPNVHTFYREAKRVLKSGGALLLLEPQKYNPFVELGRRFIKRGPEWRTTTEHPLVPRDIRLIRQEFPRVRTWEYEFLTSACQVFNLLGWNIVFRLAVATLRPLDALLRMCPVFRPLYWQVVVYALKD